MTRENEQGASAFKLPGNPEDMTDSEFEAWADAMLGKDGEATGGEILPSAESWLDREARLDEEVLAMSEEELDEVAKNYPTETPIDYKEIGVENFFDGHLGGEPSEYAKFFELKLCVYDREPFIRLALVENISESEVEVEFRLRFIPAGKLPSSEKPRITAKAPKTGLRKIMKGTRVGRQNMYFSPVTIGKVLDGWHEEWMVLGRDRYLEICQEEP